MPYFMFRITFLHSRRDPALDSSYLRLGRVLSELTSSIIHLTTKGRQPRCVNAVLYAVPLPRDTYISSLNLYPKSLYYDPTIFYKIRITPATIL